SSRDGSMTTKPSPGGGSVSLPLPALRLPSLIPAGAPQPERPRSPRGDRPHSVALPAHPQGPLARYERDTGSTEARPSKEYHLFINETNYIITLIIYIILSSGAIRAGVAGCMPSTRPSASPLFPMHASACKVRKRRLKRDTTARPQPHRRG